MACSFLYGGGRAVTEKKKSRTKDDEYEKKIHLSEDMYAGHVRVADSLQP